MAEQSTNQLSPYEQAKLYRQQLAQEKEQALSGREQDQQIFDGEEQTAEDFQQEIAKESDRVENYHQAQQKFIRDRNQAIIAQTQQLAGNAIKDQVKKQAVKRVKSAVVKWVVGTVLPALTFALPWILLIVFIIIFLIYTVYHYCELVNSLHLNWLSSYFVFDCST